MALPSKNPRPEPDFLGPRQLLGNFGTMWYSHRIALMAPPLPTGSEERLFLCARVALRHAGAILFTYRLRAEAPSTGRTSSVISQQLNPNFGTPLNLVYANICPARRSWYYRNRLTRMHHLLTNDRFTMWLTGRACRCVERT